MSTNRYIEIVPTNVPSTGVISFRGGNPVIQFIIGASDHYLLGSSIRIAGDYVHVNSQLFKLSPNAPGSLS